MTLPGYTGKRNEGCKTISHYERKKEKIRGVDQCLHNLVILVILKILNNEFDIFMLYSSHDTIFSVYP